MFYLRDKIEGKITTALLQWRASEWLDHNEARTMKETATGWINNDDNILAMFSEKNVDQR